WNLDMEKKNHEDENPHLDPTTTILQVFAHHFVRVFVYDLPFSVIGGQCFLGPIHGRGCYFPLGTSKRLILEQQILILQSKQRTNSSAEVYE
ncbi:hypothetical protein ACJX0J_023835, partial [Zea mays]